MYNFHLRFYNPHDFPHMIIGPSTMSWCEKTISHRSKCSYEIWA